MLNNMQSTDTQCSAVETDGRDGSEEAHGRDGDFSNIDADFCSNCVVTEDQHSISGTKQALPGLRISESTSEEMLTEELQREKSRSVQLHLQLLKHAASCNSCPSRNCHRMKDFLEHDSMCMVKEAGGCRLCVRINNLLIIHPRSCHAQGCRVPRCRYLNAGNR